MDDIHMLERDDAKREKGSSLTPIQANRLFRAVSNSVNLIQSDYEGGAGVLTGGGVRENRGEGDQGGEGGDGAEDDDDGDWLKMGKRFEQFLLDHKLEDYADHFSMLGCAFERDLLDITDAQLSLMVERHGLKGASHLTLVPIRPRRRGERRFLRTFSPGGRFSPPTPRFHSPP
jgi:hypothetical protein